FCQQGLCPRVNVSAGVASGPCLIGITQQASLSAPTKYEMAINLKTAKALGLRSYRAAIASRQRQRGDRIRRLNVRLLIQNEHCRIWRQAGIVLPENV